MVLRFPVWWFPRLFRGLSAGLVVLKVETTVFFSVLHNLRTVSKGRICGCCLKSCAMLLLVCVSLSSQQWTVSQASLLPVLSADSESDSLKDERLRCLESESVTVDLIACTLARSTFGNRCILNSFFSFILTSNKFSVTATEGFRICRGPRELKWFRRSAAT